MTRETGPTDARSPGDTAHSTSDSEQAQSRQRILDAAQQLFASQGFDATKTKRIAQEAGVPDGLVFYYFTTKQKLLEDLVNERNFLPELERILRSAPHEDPCKGLLDLGHRFLDVVTRREAIARILVHESASQPQVAERWRQMRESAIGIIAEYLRTSVAQSGERRVKVESVARIFLYNLIFVALIDESPNPEPFVLDMVDVLLEGALANDA